MNNTHVGREHRSDQTDQTDRTDQTDQSDRRDESERAGQTGRVMRAHGGYRRLRSYQTAEVICDGTVEFCRLYVRPRSRTRDQMEQAARSGKQNIAEGSRASGTSRKIELKLVGIARASFDELLEDYVDFLRQHNFAVWDKDSADARAVRALAQGQDRSYGAYRALVRQSAATAANTMLCLIHQANYLLDRQLAALEREFLQYGGYTEALFRARQAARRNATDRSD